MNGNRLISSSSGYDGLIKVWSLSDVDLTLIKEINKHYLLMEKVIPLSKERFASCSGDDRVKIWKDDNTYECISTLEHDGGVNSILQLKGKEVLVTAYDGDNLLLLLGVTASSLRGVSFWNINDYTKQHTVTGYGVRWSTHMIELSNGNIALSSDDEPYPIVIIDSSSYQIVTMIQLKEYITCPSSLCVFDEHSFIYACDGTFLQISSEDGRVLFHSKGGRFNGRFGGILSLEGGKYFAIENDKRISIIKPCYA